MELYANEGEPTTLNQSLDLAESAGWRLYPVWGVDGQGVCKCPEKSKCPWPGKHPVAAAAPEGVKSATSDPLRIAEMFARAPEGSNVGLAMGQGSGVVALDNDELGCGGSIRWLRKHYGDLPETRTHWSGSGNIHQLFSYPEDLPSRRLSSAYELKADGTGVLLPPSVSSWGQYEVLDDRPLAPLPLWVVDVAKGLTVIEGGEPTESKYALPEKIYESAPSRNRELYGYGCSLRAHGWSHRQILEELRRANRERCIPPMHESELKSIAGSAAKHEPGYASMISEEVLEAVAFLEEKTRSRDKSGLAAYSRWAVYRALLDTAKAHGYMHGSNVGVNISVRQLAMSSGVSKPTVFSALRALEQSKLVYRLTAGKGGNAGDLALVVPRRRALLFTTRTNPWVSIERQSEEAKPYSLRHGYMGKAKGALLEVVVEAGEWCEPIFPDQ